MNSFFQLFLLLWGCLVLAGLSNADFGRLNAPCPNYPKTVPLPKKLPLELQLAFELVDELILKAMNASRTTSTSIGFMYNNEVIWAKSFSLGSENTTLDTLYRIGSLSKIFADLMLLKLRDQKLVHIDDEVQTYWPSFQVKTPNGRGITFLQLARQLSGLGSGSPCNYYPSCNISTDEAFRRLSQTPVLYPTDYFPHYSDGAFAILARALEKPAGQTWEDFTTKQILQPLNMTSTGWSFPEEIRNRFSTPYFVGPVPDSIAFLDMQWARPTGGMYSSVNDLLKFMKMLLSANIPQDNPVLLGSSLREMFLPSYVNNDANSGFGFPFELYFQNLGKTWQTTKGGLWPGWSADILLQPKMNFGAIVLANNFLAVEISRIANDVVYPALKNWLQRNQPPVQNPGNLTLFEGMYKAFFPPIPDLELYQKIQVSPTGNSLEMISGSGAFTSILYLGWLQENSFSILPSANSTCGTEEVGNDFEDIVFYVEGGKVVSFNYSETDPYYGVSWQKQS